MTRRNVTFGKVSRRRRRRHKTVVPAKAEKHFRADGVVGVNVVQAVDLLEHGRHLALRVLLERHDGLNELTELGVRQPLVLVAAVIEEQLAEG